jgi:hypothetical protein
MHWVFANGRIYETTSACCIWPDYESWRLFVLREWQDRQKAAA